MIESNQTNEKKSSNTTSEIDVGDVANLTILKNQSQILFQFKILKNFVRNSSRF